MGETATKAVYLHHTIACLRDYPDTALRALLEAQRDFVSKVEALSPSAWVPYADHGPFFEGVRERAGDDGMVEFFSEVALLSAKSKFFMNLVSAFMRIYSGSPAALLRGLPRARQAVVRDYGVLRFLSATDRSAELELTDAPPEIWQTGTTSLLLQGSMRAMLKLTDNANEGSVVETAFAPQEGRSRYQVTW